MTITAHLDDGRVLEFPDGTDPGVIQATVKKLVSPPAQPSSIPKIPDESPNWFEQQLAKLPNSFADANAKGGVIGGFVRGAADPSIGAAQLIANLAGQGDKVNPAIQENERQYQEMRANQGREGFDASRMVGNVASPASVGVMKIAPAASFLGRTGQGAAIGGGMGAMAPVESGDSFGVDKLNQIHTDYS